MSIHRLRDLFLSVQEVQEWDLAALLSGRQEVAHRRCIKATSPWFEGEREIAACELHVLMSFPAEGETLQAAPPEEFDQDVLASLLERGLLVRAKAEQTADPEEAKSSVMWHATAALAHRQLRWRGIDVEAVLRTIQREGGAADLLPRLGVPPDPSLQRLDAISPPLSLPGRQNAGRSSQSARSTCRNFDASRNLPLDLFAQMLHTVYGAQGQSVVSGVPVLKKNSPSAGGLHPVEAYLLVQHVEDIAPGLYHYRPDTHALEPLRSLSPDEAREYASLFVARQPWFVDAHVQVILAARFQRNFWKYRNHAKAYRAVILDAGHLSQMQYLAATELGLGAFITAAINEGDIEDAFGLDPMQEGVIAVTGFGWRGERMEVLEFDPLKQVWPDWSPE